MMPKLLGLLLVLVVGWGSSLSAFSGAGMPLMENMGYFIDKSEGKPRTDVDKLDKVQAFLIEQIFLGPMMNNMSMSILSEEDQANAMIPSNFDMQYQLLNREIAKKLAKQDILQLKKRYLRTPL